MSLDQKLDRLLSRHTQIRDILASGEDIPPLEFVKLSKEFSDLSPLAEHILDLQHKAQELKDLQDILNDPTGDTELKNIAGDEIPVLKQNITDKEKEIKFLLLPKDAADERNVILEVRAGTGGDEAALFAAELLRMYQRYAELQGWKWELLHINDTGIGGIKEASANIRGRGAFARLKFESGVHRVQRIPTTESQGRIHTSAATVAVLPEAEEVDIQIADNDLRIDVFRSSGPGGQSVNTTDSAVRITHLPSGLVVQQQDEKSQHKNKAKALKILRARLFELERHRQESERAAARKTQIGTGDRSERIRTYNFPQGRVSDHRINLTLYKLDQVLEGSALDEFLDSLNADYQASRLADLGEDSDH